MQNVLPSKNSSNKNVIYQQAVDKQCKTKGTPLNIGHKSFSGSVVSVTGSSKSHNSKLPRRKTEYTIFCLQGKV